MIEIPADLHPDVAPLAFLLGDWAGAGLGQYPTIEDFRFGQEVTFGHNGKPFLSYTSASWLLDEEGAKVRPLASESGYWRLRPDRQLEVLLAHPTGISEVWVGQLDAEKPRVELVTDAVARTATAKEYTAGHRMYGLVNGDLLWAFDMAAMGHPLTNHLSAQLKRAPSA